LLRYFGEDNSRNCGYCDVCLKKNVADEGKADRQKLDEKILLELKAKAMDITDLLYHLPGFTEEEVIEEVNNMVDYGLLKIKQGVLEIKKK
jgi:ATP-dependent DNA helicase RecQ